MSEPFFKESDFRNAINQDIGGKYISLENVLTLTNRLLRERAQVVTSCFYGPGPKVWSHDISCMTDTHRALLIKIEPIAKDSAEKIVEDLLSAETQMAGVRIFSGSTLEKLISRARKLKGGEK